MSCSNGRPPGSSSSRPAATGSPCTCAPSSSSKSPSTVSRPAASIPGGLPCASPASKATDPTRGRKRPIPLPPYARCISTRAYPDAERLRPRPCDRLLGDLLLPPFQVGEIPRVAEVQNGPGRDVIRHEQSAHQPHHAGKRVASGIVVGHDHQVTVVRLEVWSIVENAKQLARHVAHRPIGLATRLHPHDDVTGLRILEPHRAAVLVQVAARGEQPAAHREVE